MKDKSSDTRNNCLMKKLEKLEKKTNVTPYNINYESNQLGTT